MWEAGSTRWQGTTIGTGLVAQAVPVARTARGLPACCGQLAVGDDLAAVDLAVQRLEHGAAERAAGQRQVDREVERVVVALEVGRERVAGGRELAVGAHDPRPDAGGDAGQRGVLRLALEGDPEHAALALDDEQRADRGAQRGVDGVGEALLHGGGGQAVEEVLGRGVMR